MIHRRLFIGSLGIPTVCLLIAIFSPFSWAAGPKADPDFGKDVVQSVRSGLWSEVATFEIIS